VVFENDLTNSGVRVGSTAVEIFAAIDVPLGWTATKVKINGSATSVGVQVYTFDLTDGTRTSEISNTGLTLNDNTDLDTNHVGSETTVLLIEVITTATTDVIYGGFVTIEPT
jgi:hypothetical protein